MNISTRLQTIVSTLMKPKIDGPLQHTHLQVAITDLVAEHEVCHRFKNAEHKPIEAVFTFPVPHDAAFLEMTAEFAGKQLKSQIQAARVADRTYDKAIADSDAAVLLRTPEPGLWCVNLGNLLPGEEVIIRLRFATELKVADGTARFSLPLVHRPRFGEWRTAALDAPEHDFAVEHPMTAQIVVCGLLANAPVECASHPIGFEKSADVLRMHVPSALLDRDLVLSFRMKELPAVVRTFKDADDDVWLATFAIPGAEGGDLPLDLSLVLDCSGSMSGDAIVQSRNAVSAIIDALSDRDAVQVLRFGSDVASMFRHPMPATSRVLQALQSMTGLVQADMGGTELGKALGVALAQLPVEAPEGRSKAVILVTDGAVQPHDLESAKCKAQELGVRVFVVAVGSSAGVEALEPFATATGAMLERALQTESIDACVMRQLRRARHGAPVALEASNGNSAVKALFPDVLYPGDGITLMAPVEPGQALNVEVNGNTVSFERGEEVASASAQALRAIYGFHQLQRADQRASEHIALVYGLLTKQTSAVLVHERDAADKSSEMPVIVKVKQMVPQDMVVNALTLFSRMKMSTGHESAVTAKHRLCIISASEYRNIPFDDDCPSDGDEQFDLAESTQLSPTRLRELLQALTQVLRDAYLGDPCNPITIEQALGRLDAELVVDARRLIDLYSWPKPVTRFQDALAFLLVLTTSLAQELGTVLSDADLEKLTEMQQWWPESNNSIGESAEWLRHAIESGVAG